MYIVFSLAPTVYCVSYVAMACVNVLTVLQNCYSMLIQYSVTYNNIQYADTVLCYKKYSILLQYADTVLCYIHTV